MHFSLCRLLFYGQKVEHTIMLSAEHSVPRGWQVEFKLSNLTNSHSLGDGIRSLIIIIGELCSLAHRAHGTRCLDSPFWDSRPLPYWQPTQGFLVTRAQLEREVWPGRLDQCHCSNGSAWLSSSCAPATWNRHASGSLLLSLASIKERWGGE